MKLFLIFIFAGLILPNAINAATPPDQPTVDNWVALALASSSEQIIGDGRGKFACEYDVNIDGAFPASGKTLQDAQSRVALQCIKNKCNHMGEILAKGRGEIDQLGDEELTNIMRGLGYNESDIAHALANRKHPNQEYLEKTSTCTYGSPSLRAFAVDFCFSIPMRCYKK